MAQRHKSAVHTWLHPYSTQDLMGWLRSARDEIKEEVLAEYPPDDDLDFESIIDTVIERDPAVQMLAWKLYWRCGCWKLDSDKDRVAHINAMTLACSEGAND